eukprot:3776411-Amphidinium_carterae.1
MERSWKMFAGGAEGAEEPLPKHSEKSFALGWQGLQFSCACLRLVCHHAQLCLCSDVLQEVSLARSVEHGSSADCMQVILFCHNSMLVFLHRASKLRASIHGTLEVSRLQHQERQLVFRASAALAYHRITTFHTH